MAAVRAACPHAADTAVWVCAVGRRRGVELDGPGSVLAINELRGVVKTLLAAPMVGLAPTANRSGSGAGTPSLGLVDTVTVRGLSIGCMTNGSSLNLYLLLLPNALRRTTARCHKKPIPRTTAVNTHRHLLPCAYA